MRYLSLAALLAVLWLGLSGHFEGLILAMGAASVALVVWLARRMQVIDEEGMPLDSLHRAAPYSIWLLGQIVKANLAMLPVLFARRPAIRPRVIVVPAGVEHCPVAADLESHVGPWAAHNYIEGGGSFSSASLLAEKLGKINLLTLLGIRGPLFEKLLVETSGGPGHAF